MLKLWMFGTSIFLPYRHTYSYMVRKNGSWFITSPWVKSSKKSNHLSDGPVSSSAGSEWGKTSFGLALLQIGLFKELSHSSVIAWFICAAWAAYVTSTLHVIGRI